MDEKKKRKLRLMKKRNKERKKVFKKEKRNIIKYKMK